MVSELVTDINALIVSVGALLGAVGTIVLGVSAWLKAGKAKEVAEKVGNGLKETDLWIAENEQKLLTVLEVSYNLAPAQAKEAAEKYRELIVKYNGDLEAVRAELEKLYGVIPK